MNNNKDTANTNIINRRAFKDLLRKARTSGRSEDLYNVGCCHNYGWGTPHNYEKASEFYEEAGSSPEAELNLGLLYLTGNGVEQDTLRAMGLFKRAAEKGNSEAMNALALVLLGIRSTELPCNEEAGMKWLIKAAEGGHAAAMNNLGVAYAAGAHGLPMDREKAKHWLKLAVEQGHDTAKFALLELLVDELM